MGSLSACSAGAQGNHNTIKDGFIHVRSAMKTRTAVYCRGITVKPGRDDFPLWAISVFL